MAGDWQIVIPPSILLEAARTPNDAACARIAAALTSRGKHREHLSTEAREEMRELISAARIHRRSWIRMRRMPGHTSTLENFWTKGIWQIYAQKPTSLRGTLPDIETQLAVDKLLSEQKAVRKENPWLAKPVNDHWRLFARESDLAPDGRIGWAGGGDVDGWRAEAAMTYWVHLVDIPARCSRTREDTSYADWASEWIDLCAVSRDRARWNQFFYRDVQGHELPRTWMRSMLPALQLTSKIGPGNPRDAQHASHLFDADLFITADARYAALLELVRVQSPRPFASVGVASATSPPTDEVVRLVAAFRRGNSGV